MSESESKHSHYYQALARLMANTPLVVEKNTSITNDSVALEAGRKKGTIKSGRPAFAALIEAINEARALQSVSNKKTKPVTPKTEHKAEAERYRALLEAALGREIMLINKIYELEAQLSNFSASNVVRLPRR
ncbi:hypothetical protein ABRP29_07075 [Pseudomonas sp. WHRI 8822A]|uniref:hypothetical protein n=1 Tax=Pseudomonas sp. WHRI 8822A TaxID=3162568 RepID=UPI0032EE496D